MEETTETTTRLESDLNEEVDKSSSLDGPNLQLNQNISDETETIIDNDRDDVDTNDGTTSEEGVQE